MSTTKVVSAVKGKFEDLFKKGNINDFDQFHLAILDMFATLNQALPGKHWVVPPVDKIQECFNDVNKESDEGKKKQKVVDFMKKIQLNKADNTLLFIGLATPPAAMAAKKAGESVPQLKFIKRIPDVLFVPAATLLSLVSVKITRSLLLQQSGSEDRLGAGNKQGKSNLP